MSEIKYIKTAQADVEMLIDEAKAKGVTEISLDATETADLLKNKDATQG